MAWVVLAPPGVTRMVLGGGGAMVGELELELELELLALSGEPHASMATVWVRVLLGMTISLDPGGIVLAPESATTPASEHEVTAMVSGLCCLGTTTVRTPGFCRAAATGSMLLELEEELPPPLLPQPASTVAVAAQMVSAVTQRLVLIQSSTGRFSPELRDGAFAPLQRCRTQSNVRPNGQICTPLAARSGLIATRP